ncbi:MAG: DNA recombination protein RmuC [Patescibacteria group bacterium]|jgi:DNA recombination protein RmuC
MENYLFILFFIILTLGLAIVIFLLMKRKDGGDNEKLAVMSERLAMIGEQNKELRQTIDSKLSETHRATQEQINQTIRTVQGISGQSAKQIADVVAGLTKLEETNKQVVNFSAQLQNLQDILKNPKQRGILGEYYLETLLKNVLPPGSYEMQYKFKNGDIVDAVVFVKDKIIPIDSKFSLENYNRLVEERNETERARLEKVFVNDLKMRIKETAKYIKPGEKTMDFAFMFIPHESIYYDLLVNKVGMLHDEDTNSLIQRAAGEYKVIIVSPTSFLAYLQTVMQGLRAMQIEESAKEIRSGVEKLGRHLYGYDEYFKKVGSSLSTTVSHYNNAHKQFNLIDKDVAKITGGETKIEPLAVDKPQVE